LLNDDINQLRSFNERAEDLIRSNFVDHIRKVKELMIIIDENSDGTTNVPNKEATKAFVLDFRFFIQKGEKTSFRKMSKTYSRLPVSNEVKKKFFTARQMLNQYLDSNPEMERTHGFEDATTDTEITFKSKGRHVTRREIINVFIYGKYAHEDDEKKRKYDSLMKNGLTALGTSLEFAMILYRIIGVIQGDAM
jgi:hypothetical protein